MHYKTLITAFPRIGEKRELKTALESYWAGKSSMTCLQDIARELRQKNWRIQKEHGIDFISCNDFSQYDSMLDTAVLLGAIPERFQRITDIHKQYFAMARGEKNIPALEMTKWFNTNYHYIVPELNDNISFTLNAEKIITEYKEAQRLGINPKINIIGPITFLGLSKTTNAKKPYAYFDKVLALYIQLMQKLSELNETVYIQCEEPILATNPTQEQLHLLDKAYQQLPLVSNSIKLIVTTYFEHSNEATDVLVHSPIWGLGLDFIYGPKNIDSLSKLNKKMLIAGIVDGRNIWKNNYTKSLAILDTIQNTVPKEQIIIATSCSLLHVPYCAAAEPDSPVKQWFSFAYEKLDEVKDLSAIFHAALPHTDAAQLLEKNTRINNERLSSPLIHNAQIADRISTITKIVRECTFTERIAAQRNALPLPKLPTTTIGSFPQTPEIRTLRRDFKKNSISETDYTTGIQQYIRKCVSFQEEIGLDILVHGEPERNDMVEYFGEMLHGFHFTMNGWVQSYGSRCVKPPILYGDVSRPKPMTVRWITYAQSLTKKPMKGMLTGPVTIVNWSFVRDDKPHAEVAQQIALALADEINDLQNAGIKIIQVDEAAFKEGYPLRNENINEYEKWAVANFKLAVSSAHKETQIHTHMCYSEFNDIIKTIEAMDADVITIETARSGNEILTVFKETGYTNEIGPGVYDIHSPRIPSKEEFVQQIHEILNVLPVSQLWINPDCGLKTRKWEEVRPALTNMMLAVQEVRNAL